MRQACPAGRWRAPRYGCRPMRDCPCTDRIEALRYASVFKNYIFGVASRRPSRNATPGDTNHELWIWRMPFAFTPALSPEQWSIGVPIKKAQAIAPVDNQKAGSGRRSTPAHSNSDGCNRNACKPCRFPSDFQAWSHEPRSYRGTHRRLARDSQANPWRAPGGIGRLRAILVEAGLESEQDKGATAQESSGITSAGPSCDEIPLPPDLLSRKAMTPPVNCPLQPFRSVTCGDHPVAWTKRVQSASNARTSNLSQTLLILKHRLSAGSKIDDDINQVADHDRPLTTCVIWLAVFDALGQSGSHERGRGICNECKVTYGCCISDHDRGAGRI